jgi:hypothetical protein
LVAPHATEPRRGPEHGGTPMPKQDPIAARRLLRAQVADLATGVGLAIRTARRWNVPVEPGVSEGRTALVRWVALIDDLLSKRGE